MSCPWVDQATPGDLGKWVDRDCNSAFNLQRAGKAPWRPVELCWRSDRAVAPALGKEYQALRILVHTRTIARHTCNVPSTEARDVLADTVVELNFYVRLRIGTQMVKTDVVKHSAAPKFLRDMRLAVSSPSTEVLTVEMLQCCPRGDLVVGTAQLPLASLVNQGTLVQWVPLITVDEEVGARLCLVLRYLQGAVQPLLEACSCQGRTATLNKCPLELVLGRSDIQLLADHVNIYNNATDSSSPVPWQGCRLQLVGYRQTPGSQQLQALFCAGGAGRSLTPSYSIAAREATRSALRTPSPQPPHSLAHHCLPSDQQPAAPAASEQLLAPSRALFADMAPAAHIPSQMQAVGQARSQAGQLHPTHTSRVPHLQQQPPLPSSKQPEPMPQPDMCHGPRGLPAPLPSQQHTQQQQQQQEHMPKLATTAQVSVAAGGQAGQGSNLAPATPARHAAHPFGREEPGSQLTALSPASAPTALTPTSSPPGTHSGAGEAWVAAGVPPSPPSSEHLLAPPTLAGSSHHFTQPSPGGRGGNYGGVVSKQQPATPQHGGLQAGGPGVRGQGNGVPLPLALASAALLGALMFLVKPHARQGPVEDVFDRYRHRRAQYASSLDGAHLLDHTP
ncbi:hypothetical protein QJQ45_010405 [Haematococcus lacustris]|nr:hypothetical protein QJQ45_010405 [Haematococcus lacustris]